MKPSVDDNFQLTHSALLQEAPSMIAKATSRFVLPALVLGLALAVVGPPIAVAE
ncbi:MAG: hypothetical protein ACI9XZ_003276, partial [Alphaproteobacteria bacterium]